MPVEEIKIGMLGMGTVGGGVASILQTGGRLIEERTGMALRLERVLVRDTSRPRALTLAPGTLTADAAAVIDDPSIKVLVELIGGIEPARTYITRALQQGKYVVTANKDLIARHGAELLEMAQQFNRNIFYEAGVGGGIPLIRPLKHCLVANKISRIIGIINGTTNYILTRMDREDMDFDRALELATSLGYAEEDPASDLNGVDAAYKLAILAGIAFSSRIDPDGFSIRGIRDVTREDIRYARELGYTIKLLAVGEQLAQGLALQVHPFLVPLTHPLAAVLDEFNAIFIEGDAVGEVMLYGRGAGAAPTASAVVADIIDAARGFRSQPENGVNESLFRPAAILPAAKLTSQFYLRLLARDIPGVFASLATAFGDEGVSLDMIIQKRSEGGIAEIVLVTHRVSEQNFNRSLNRIMKLSTIEPQHSVLRVLS